MSLLSRRGFLRAAALAAGGALSLPRTLCAMGARSRFRFAALKLGPGWACREGAGRGLLYEVDLRTSIDVAFDPVSVALDDERLFDYPLLFLAGDQGFDLPPARQIERLASFLRHGGMLVIDSATGVAGDAFDRSARRFAAAVCGEKALASIPFADTLFKSYYLVRRCAGRLAVSPAMEGVIEEDRVCLVYSINDLHGAWQVDRMGHWAMQPAPGGETQRKLALAIGVNLVMYALTVNYKSDQVHAAWRLRRRMTPW